MQLEDTVLATLLAACLLLLVSLPAHDIVRSGQSPGQYAGMQCSCVPDHDLQSDTQLPGAGYGTLSCTIENTTAGNYR